MKRKIKETPHLRLRVKIELLARLERLAKKNGRTLHGEIIQRLEKSLEYETPLERQSAETIIAIVRELETARSELAMVYETIHKTQLVARDKNLRLVS